MSREDKLDIILYIALALITSTLIVSAFEPRTIATEIWLPENHSIVNRVDGNYLPTNTPVVYENAEYITFDTLRNLYRAYEEVFSKEQFTVTVLSKGIVYYSWQANDKSFFTRKYYENSIMAIPYNGQVVSMPSNNVLMLYYNKDLLAVGLFAVVVAAADFILVLAVDGPILYVINRLKPSNLPNNS
jgi:hypothetical protein